MAHSGRIQLGRSERKCSLVRSFSFSTAPPHEWFRIFRACERAGIGSRGDAKAAQITWHKGRPERSIKHVSSSDKYFCNKHFNDTQVRS